jgi:hypothetical protein
MGLEWFAVPGGYTVRAPLHAFPRAFYDTHHVYRQLLSDARRRGPTRDQNANTFRQSGLQRSALNHSLDCRARRADSLLQFAMKCPHSFSPDSCEPKSYAVDDVQQRAIWSGRLKTGCLLSLSVDTADAKLCIFNLQSISQAGRRSHRGVSGRIRNEKRAWIRRSIRSDSGCDADFASSSPVLRESSTGLDQIRVHALACDKCGRRNPV